MSLQDPRSWDKIKPTESALEYRNPIHNMKTKKIIELDKKPYVECIIVKSVRQSDSLLEAKIRFKNGSEQNCLLNISNIKTLMTQEEPALRLVETNRH